MAFSAEQFIGPLPHPDLLKKYQDIDPNLLDRVLTMAEEEGRARREGERLIVEAEVYSIECYPAEILRGQILVLCSRLCSSSSVASSFGRATILLARRLPPADSGV